VITEDYIQNQLFYKMKCNGRYIIVKEWVYTLVKLLAKNISVAEIQAILLRRDNIVKTDDEINNTIKYLLSFEVLHNDTDDKNGLFLSRQHEGFFHTMTKLTFKNSVLPESVTEKIGWAFSFLFSPLVMVLLIAFSLVPIAMTIITVVQNKNLFDLGYVLSGMARYLPIFFLIGIISSVLHEFGHIGAAKYAGCSVGEIGVGIYFFSPVFYAHLSDINILNRGKQVLVDSAGIFLNTIFTACVSIFALLMHNDILSIFVLLLTIDILYNLLPFTKTDGYWVLSDLTQTPNLHWHIDILIAQIIKKRSLPESSQIQYRILALYGLLLLLYFGVNVFFTVVLLPGYIKAYPDLLLKYWDGIAISFSNVDISGLLESMYYFTIILVPVIGILVLFYKLFPFITNMKGKAPCNE
jgi:putative peptide zinc metalloprotease protein